METAAARETEKQNRNPQSICLTLNGIRGKLKYADPV